MAKKGEFYKCPTCGIIVQVLHEGEGEMICCGAPMSLLPEKNQEEPTINKKQPCKKRVQQKVPLNLILGIREFPPIVLIFISTANKNSL